MRNTLRFTLLLLIIPTLIFFYSIKPVFPKRWEPSRGDHALRPALDPTLDKRTRFWTAYDSLIERGEHRKAADNLLSTDTEAELGLERLLAHLAAGLLYFKAGADDLARYYLSDEEIFGSPFGDYALFHLGEMEHGDNNFRSSESFFRRLKERHPDSLFFERALRKSIESKIEYDSTEKVLETIDKALDVVPSGESGARLWKLKGDVLERRNRPEEALRCYEEVYFEYPETSAAAELGSVKSWRHHVKRAAKEGAYGERFFERGEKLFSLKWYRSALASYKVARKAEAVGRDLLDLRMGVCLYKTRRYRKATDHLTALRKGESEYRPEGTLYLARCLLKRRGAGRFVRLAKEVVTEASPDLAAEAMLDLAEYFERKGDLEEALKHYKGLTFGEVPEEVKEIGLWKSGFISYQLKNYGWADRYMNGLLEHTETDERKAQALYWLAKSARIRGKEEEADLLLKRCAELFPYTYYGEKGRSHFAGQETANVAVRSRDGSNRAVALETWLEARFSGNGNGFSKIKGLAKAHLNEHLMKELQFRLGKHPEDEGILEAGIVASSIHEDYLKAYLLFRKRYGNGAAPDEIPLEIIRSVYPVREGETVAELSEKYRLDSDLVLSLIHQESVFNPTAKSPAGARGLMQIMPATGKGIAKDLNFSPYKTSMLYDPRVNISFGTYYFSDLVDEFQGKVEVALAGYNAGPARARRWWESMAEEDIDLFIESIPFKETRLYVKKILFNYGIYKRAYREDPVS